MRLGFVLSVFVAGLAALPAFAESLRDRMEAGARNASKALKQAATRVDETVDSTIDLAKNDPDPAVTREKLDAMVAGTLGRLFEQEPDARALFDISAGYAVFDTRRATLVGLVAGFGRGVAISRETGQRTYMNMGTGGVGFAFGIGGFESQIVILFQDTGHFDRFVTEGYDATAQASSRMGDDEAGETLRFDDGRSIFVLDRRGWRVNMSAAGTKYWAAPELNAPADMSAGPPPDGALEGNP